ncbi:MAG: heparin lyase I family protein [Thiocapsa sp.]|uniref:heparin lyase I family protein n=1 Tax=Thiocapsa sp. TaxID=2024551 RepID=UPI001BCDA7F9|nr:heparin lyase I family protein [Thiocapsa sp.]QVL50296.1 MAG: heparin lyase I family protein [Thiocapsa sp.]
MTYIEIPRKSLFFALMLLAFSSSADILHFSFEPGENPSEFTGPFGGLSHPDPSINTLPSISTEKALSGTSSLKSYLHIYDSPKPFRSQALLSRTQYPLDFSRGAETESYWVGFAVWIPEWFPRRDPVGKLEDIFFDFHTSPAPGDPWGTCSGAQPFNLKFYQETPTTGYVKLDIQANVDHSTCEIAMPPRNYMVNQRNIGAYRTGEWNSFVINIRFDPVYGFAKVWINGKLGIDYDGPVYHYGVGNPYPIWGNYLDWWERITNDPAIFERTLYYDEIRIATGEESSYDSVAPKLPSGTELSAPINLRISD